MGAGGEDGGRVGWRGGGGCFCSPPVGTHTHGQCSLHIALNFKEVWDEKYHFCTVSDRWGNVYFQLRHFCTFVCMLVYVNSSVLVTR